MRKEDKQAVVNRGYNRYIRDRRAPGYNNGACTYGAGGNSPCLVGLYMTPKQRKGNQGMALSLPPERLPKIFRGGVGAQTFQDLHDNAAQYADGNRVEFRKRFAANLRRFCEQNGLTYPGDK